MKQHSLKVHERAEIASFRNKQKRTKAINDHKDASEASNSTENNNIEFSLSSSKSFE